MFEQLALRDVESVDLRDGARYAACGHAQFTSDAAAPTSADLLNISRSGAAVRCYGQLRVGARYTIQILGLGAIPCEVVRSFDVDCYGVKFALREAAQSRLDQKLEDLFALCCGGFSDADRPANAPTRSITFPWRTSTADV